VEDVPAHGRVVGTRWSLRSLPTITILRFCACTARKLPSLVRPSDYYPLLVMQVGSGEIAEKSQHHQKGLQGTGAIG